MNPIHGEFLHDAPGEFFGGVEETPSEAPQDEEQRWLTARWCNDHKRSTHDAGGASRRTDQKGIDHVTRPSDTTDESICSPTLEKLYAAQRKQKEDLKRQIDDAMAQNLK